MDITYYLKKHLSFSHRGTGTNNEQKAAEMIYKEYEKLGFSPKIHKFKIVSNCLLVYSFEYFLIVLSVILGFTGLKWLGIITYIIGILLIYEFPTKKIKTNIIKQVYPAKSQNVFAYLKPQEKTKQTVVLIGHYDTSRYFIGLKFLNKLASRQSKFLLNIDKYLPNFFRTQFVIVNICVLLALPLSLVNFGKFDIFLTIVVLAPTLIAFLILLTSSFSRFVPGAIDNASGSSVVLALAEYFKKNPLVNTQLLFLNSGSEENMTKGAVELLLRKNLDKESTYIINFDGLGGDELAVLYGESNWYGASRFYDKELFSVVDDLLETNFKDVKKLYLPVQTDCSDIINEGYKVVTTFVSTQQGNLIEDYHQLSDTRDKVNINNLQKALDLCKEVLCLIDSAK